MEWLNIMMRRRFFNYEALVCLHVVILPWLVHTGGSALLGMLTPTANLLLITWRFSFVLVHRPLLLVHVLSRSWGSPSLMHAGVNQLGFFLEYHRNGSNDTGSIQGEIKEKLSSLWCIWSKGNRFGHLESTPPTTSVRISTIKVVWGGRRGLRVGGGGGALGTAPSATPSTSHVMSQPRHVDGHKGRWRRIRSNRAGSERREKEVQSDNG